MIGRTIGNYVVEKQIGQGGMGVVYVAEHPRIHRRVAIKVLLPQYSSNPQVVQRFFNEAKAATEVHSEHIIDIIDFGELDDGASYIIMEWLDGKSLADLLDEVGKLDVPRAIHITRGIGRALAAAHKHGIIHRDLKPDNIFLISHNGDNDFVKVLDFGIAKLTGSDQAASDVKTKTGALIGTPSFMSPEQCRGIAIDQRSDIYSLGVIVYRMLTGRLPFEAEALGELLLQHMTQRPISLREHDPGLPSSVDAAVLRSLEKDPQKRQPHVDDLLRELAGVQTGAFPIYDDGKSGLDTLGGAAGERGQGATAGSSKIGRWALIGGVAAALAGGVAFMTVKPPAAITKPVVTAPTPGTPTPVAPTPGTPTPVTPTPTPTPPTVPAHDVPAPAAEVHVIIRAQPANAELYLDDAKIDNPYDARFARSDAKHHLVAKAPGHRAESSWVSFDQDHELTLTLTKGSGTHDEPRKLPTPPPVVPDKPDGKTETKPEPKKAEPKRPPETKPVVADKPDNPDKAVYKGTKGKLITEFPDSDK